MATPYLLPYNHPPHPIQVIVQASGQIEPELARPGLVYIIKDQHEDQCHVESNSCLLLAKEARDCTIETKLQWYTAIASQESSSEIFCSINQLDAS